MINLLDISFISNVDFKCNVLTKPKFTFTNLNDSYLVCCHGRYEPTFLIVSKVLYELYKVINNTSIWKQFNASHVLISDNIESNKIAFINLNKIDDSKYNVLVEFENTGL